MKIIRNKTNLSQFLFKSVILLIISVYILYKLISLIADSYAETVFSDVAKEYSAESFFTGQYLEKREIINRIHKVGGMIMILDAQYNVEYLSVNKAIKKITFKDLVQLENGEYKFEGIQYHASIKEIEDLKYGLVILPNKIINKRISIQFNDDENFKTILYFLLIRTFLLIVGLIVLVWFFTRLLNKELIKPLYELKNNFNKLGNENYSITFDTENIEEFNQLNHSFYKLSKDLETLNNNKKEYQKKRDRLFSDISHDIKTPVTVIKGYSEGILDGKIQEDKAFEYINLILNNANSLEKIAIELSDIVYYDRDDYRLSPITVDIYEYIRRLIIDFIPVFEKNNITIICDFEYKTFYYDIDTKLFDRVFNNLMVNIIDHNQGNIEAFFDLKISEKFIKIIVADNGLPIEDKLKDIIFDEFVTYDESRTSFKKNSGLGLSIVKKIVELHKGRVYLQSNYTGYTKAFIIELPL